MEDFRFKHTVIGKNKWTKNVAFHLNHFSILRFTEGLEYEYGRKGVTIQCILPGYVVSNMSKLRSVFLYYLKFISQTVTCWIISVNYFRKKLLISRTVQKSSSNKNNLQKLNAKITIR